MPPLLLCILSEFSRIHAMCFLEDICFMKLDRALASVKFLSYVFFRIPLHNEINHIPLFIGKQFTRFATC